MSTEERSVNQPEQPSLSEQRLIRRAKLKELQDAGQDPFQITKYVVKHHSADIKENFDALEGTMTSVAGRIMSKRGMGKAVFCDLQDGKGRIQLYVRIDELGEEAFAKFKKTDIGDIVGVEGEVFKTKRGEISVKAHKVTLLSKSLQPRTVEKYTSSVDVLPTLANLFGLEADYGLLTGDDAFSQDGGYVFFNDNTWVGTDADVSAEIVERRRVSDLILTGNWWGQG